MLGRARAANTLLNRYATLGVMAQARTFKTTGDSKWSFETLAVSVPKPFVAHVELNRPKKGNAMNFMFWKEMRECFSVLGDDEDIRAVVISGRGKIFTGGLDLESLTSMPEFFQEGDPGRRARKLKNLIQDMQQSFTQIEDCTKPVIAAVHNACIGGGVDLITACDVRFCEQDSYFQVKEVDLGLAADVGTLQRLPKVTGNDSFVREICYTARKVYSEEAMKMGIVSRILPSKDEVVNAALETASLIAEKSPIAVQTTKEALVYSKDHPTKDSLNHMRLLNQCMLQSEDVIKSAEGMMSRTKPVFSKL